MNPRKPLRMLFRSLFNVQTLRQHCVESEHAGLIMGVLPDASAPLDSHICNLLEVVFHHGIYDEFLSELLATFPRRRAEIVNMQEILRGFKSEFMQAIDVSVAQSVPSVRLGRKALLIAASVKTEIWHAESLSVMHRLLTARGFECNAVQSEQATRYEILNALVALCSRIQPDDTVVVYYAGHGSMFRTGHDVCIPVLLPVDSTASTRDDPRLILGAEFYLHLLNLEKRTKNLTVIFDCSYAGMFADPAYFGVSPHEFAEQRLILRSMGERIEARRGDRAGATSAHMNTNEPQLHGHRERLRQTTILTSCQAHEYSYYDPSDGGSVSLYVRQMEHILTDVPNEMVLSSKLVTSLISERCRLFRSQTPGLHGPGERPLFADTDHSMVTALVRVRRPNDGGLVLELRTAAGSRTIPLPDDATDPSLLGSFSMRLYRAGQGAQAELVTDTVHNGELLVLDVPWTYPEQNPCFLQVFLAGEGQWSSLPSRSALSGKLGMRIHLPIEVPIEIGPGPAWIVIVASTSPFDLSQDLSLWERPAKQISVAHFGLSCARPTMP